MRLYTFTNFYLSSIQQGIQPAHCIADMFVKYQDETTTRDVLFDWATNHKTLICLNGGNAAGIREIIAVLDEVAPTLGLPYGYFREDKQSLDETMTCCGIVVPEPIYTMAANLRMRDPMPGGDQSDESAGVTHDTAVSQAELKLINLMNSARLAS